MDKIQKILSYLLVAVLSSMITMTVFGGAPAPGVSKLDALADLIEIYFIEETDRTAMEEAAAVAMVDSLGDKWSYYLPAKEYQAYTEMLENAYIGIGITIVRTEDNSGFYVKKVNEGDPAEKAGMLAGDIITAVEGQSVAGMTTAQVRELVGGEENGQVTLTVLRGEETLELLVSRGKILTPVAEAQMLSSGMGLITIYNFDDRCAQETIAAIEELLQQGATALIFDVRGNPGGYKNEMVALLDYLLPEGPLFRSEDYTGAVTVEESDADYLDIPMAVLVDANSYSAAEFFAAALDEYDAAITVGEKTCGKGYFQTAFEFTDGSALNISIGKYTTPNGVSLAGVGITPELPVPVDEETALRIYLGSLDPEEDPQIQAAVKALQ